VSQPGEPPSELVQQLRERVDTRSQPSVARDPVNQPMIRHWCDAMGDDNPNYVDPDAAAASPFGEIVAPPAMLNAWGMPGLKGRDPEAVRSDPAGQVYAMLDAAGFTSVVATDSAHEYARYLKLGDEIHMTTRVSSVSDEKKTALGVGHFVTSETEYTNQSGEKLGSMTFRILKFKPGTGRMAAADSSAEAAPRPPRPTPGISRDTRFFWDGLDEGELRIQQCACGVLHHPPVVRCPDCGSYDLGYTVSSGRGVIYSHVEVNHPQVPGFDYPLPVVLVELEEGTRLIANVGGIEPDDVAVGLEVECYIERGSDGAMLPVFRPAAQRRRETTLTLDEVSVGDVLGPLPIPITPTLIVSTAIASRDYQDVHHDRDLAIKRGSPDIFMNILTSSGLTARYVNDWAGPDARMKKLAIRLGVPNYPYDTMTMTGEVSEKSETDGRVTVSVQGRNRMGNHLTGTIELELPHG
jgi:uncharacterized OB-fold protein/acyl dehydratase